MAKEIGNSWGFTDPHEVTIGPMKASEYHHWFHQRQAVVQIAFLLDDDIVSQEPEEPDYPKVVRTWQIV